MYGDKNIHAQTAISSALPFQCLESLCHPPVGSLHAKQGHSGLLVWGFGVFGGRCFFFKKKTTQSFQDPRSWKQTYNDKQRLPPRCHQPPSISK